jgi:hypothetical protein
MARLAKSDGPATRWRTKLEAFEGVTDGSLTGYLDTSAGLTYADKACVWARHLCVKAGVRFILGPEKGKLQQLVIEHTPSGRRVTGITTVDGRRHAADVVVMACRCLYIEPASTDRKAGHGHPPSSLKQVRSSKPQPARCVRSSCQNLDQTCGTSTRRKTSRSGHTDSQGTSRQNTEGSMASPGVRTG